jgi:hypothetical protein
MKLSERSIKIKELISGQVDMGTFGLVELELIEFDKELHELKKLRVADVIKNEVAVCNHPIEKRIGWRDSSILCDECDCIIEQYGKEINPPTEIY